KSFLVNLWRIILKFTIAFVVLSILSVIIFRFVPLPFTPLMIIRCGEQMIHGEKIKLEKSWVSIKEMSAAIPLAVIAAEDQKFEDHFGFDFDAIKKAEMYNSKH